MKLNNRKKENQKRSTKFTKRKSVKLSKLIKNLKAKFRMHWKRINE